MAHCQSEEDLRGVNFTTIPYQVWWIHSMFKPNSATCQLSDLGLVKWYLKSLNSSMPVFVLDCCRKYQHSVKQRPPVQHFTLSVLWESGPCSARWSAQGLSLAALQGRQRWGLTSEACLGKDRLSSSHGCGQHSNLCRVSDWALRLLAGCQVEFSVRSLWRRFLCTMAYLIKAGKEELIKRVT